MHNLGSFDDEKKAACKYDEHALLHGKPLNFPAEGQKQAKKRKANLLTGAKSKEDLWQEEEAEEVLKLM